MKRRRWLAWFGGFLVLVLGLAVVSQLTFRVAAADGGDQNRATVQTMITLTEKAEDQLKSGDTAGARTTGEAIEQNWKTIERDIARQAPDREEAVDESLDAANDALAGPNPASAAESLGQLEATLGQLDQDLANGVNATEPVAVDQIAIAQQVRQLEAAQSALDHGDLATARADLAAFHQAWPSIETMVLASSSSAYGTIENQMTTATADLNSNPADVAGARVAIASMHDNLAPLVGASDHYGWFDSAITLLREGMEALLVLAALLAFVTRAGRRDLRLRVWLGAGAGVMASLVVAAALQIVFSHAASGINRELLEGVTGLVAAVMLLSVSFWLHRQSSLNDWRKFVSSQAGRALASGSAFTLPFIAFLAVFREGAETTILYLGMAASISLSDLLLGMAAGLAALVVIGLALFKFGLRLSMRPFFATMSVLLYYLAFKFVGTGIHSLQIAGVLPASTASYLPSVELLGLFPTWQTTLAQLLLLVAAVAAVGLLGAATRQRRANRLA